MVDQRPTVIRTHRPVVPTLEGVKREGWSNSTQTCQAPKDCTSRPVEKTPELC